MTVVKKPIAVVVVSAALLSATLAACRADAVGCALKPVALAGGDGDDLAGMTAEVCVPNSIRYERFADSLPRTEDFSKYSCIYLGGIPAGTDVAALAKAAEAFARAGGTFIVAGQKAIDALGEG